MRLDVIGKSFRASNSLYRIVDARHVAGEWIIYAEEQNTGRMSGTPLRAALRYADVINILDEQPESSDSSA